MKFKTGEVVFFDDTRGIVVDSYPATSHRGWSHDVYWPEHGTAGQDVWDSDLMSLKRYAELVKGEGGQ